MSRCAQNKGNKNERQIYTRALFGDEAFEKLKNSRVAVFGLGGVGGYALEALARSGIGALDVIDPDYIDESNINRQLLALSSSVGQKKTQTAVKRLKEINPELIVSAHELFYSPENADAIDLKQYDAVADAIDFFPGKLELALRSRDAGVKLVSCMGTGKKTAPSLIRVSDISETSVCPLARKMRAELKKRGVKKLKVVYSEEQPTRPINDMAISCRNHCICPPGAAHKCTERRDIPGSTAFVPSVVGLIIAGEVIKDLTKDVIVKAEE